MAHLRGRADGHLHEGASIVAERRIVDVAGSEVKDDQGRAASPTFAGFDPPVVGPNVPAPERDAPARAFAVSGVWRLVMVV